MDAGNLQYGVFAHNNENRRRIRAAELRKRKAERMIAIAIVFAVEMAGAILVTALTAAVVLPMAYAERGYFSVGGEWLLLMLVAIVTYTAMHSYIFDIAAKRKGGRNAGRDKKARRKVSGSGD